MTEDDARPVVGFHPQNCHNIALANRYLVDFWFQLGFAHRVEQGGVLYKVYYARHETHANYTHQHAVSQIYVCQSVRRRSGRLSIP